MRLGRTIPRKFARGDGVPAQGRLRCAPVCTGHWPRSGSGEIQRLPALTEPGTGPKIAGCFHRQHESAGGIPKRPTGADCKSAGLRLRWFESTSLHHFGLVETSCSATGCNAAGGSRCGSSSTVEPQPSKLMVRVRFPSPAPLNVPCGSRITRFHIVAHVAQSVEHLLGKEEVEGSIPFVSTILRGSACIAGPTRHAITTSSDFETRQPWQRVSSSAPSPT